MATEIKRVINIETKQSENSINGLNKDIKALKKTLGDITIGTEEYNEVLSQLASKQSQLKEINASMRAEARTSARRLETIQKSASGLASAYSALNAAMSLTGKSSENFEKVLIKVQSGIAIAQGLGGIKDLIEEIPNLIDDFKNLGNVVSGFFNGLNTKIDPFNNRLNETAARLSGLADKGLPNVNLTAGASGGTTIINNTTNAAAGQARTLVPLNDQWNKYNERIKKNTELIQKSQPLIEKSKANFEASGKQLNSLAGLQAILGKAMEKNNANLAKENEELIKKQKELETNNELYEEGATTMEKFGRSVKSVFATVSWTLLISALITAAYKLLDYVKNLKTARQEQVKFNQELNKTTANLASKGLSTYYELAEAYKQIGDNAEQKKAFLENYRKEIEATGLAINDVNDADDAFVNNTENYVQAVIARAKIDAYREQIANKTKETLLENQELERQLASGEAGKLNKMQLFSLSSADPTVYPKLMEEYSKANTQAVKDQIKANDEALNSFITDAVAAISNLKVQFESFWSRPSKKKDGGGSGLAEIIFGDIDDVSSEYEAVLDRIAGLDKDSRTKELDDLNEYYKKAIELARQYGDDTTIIENAWGKEISDLRKKWADEDAKNAKEARIKEYNEQLTIIKQLSEQQLKEIDPQKFFHSTSIFGFQWQTGKDIDAEYNQDVSLAKKKLDITKWRIDQENALIDEQLKKESITGEERTNLLKQQSDNRQEIIQAEANYDVAVAEATNKKKQKIWQTYNATVQATADVFGGVADAVGAIWGEQSEAAKGFQAAQAVFNALSAANGAYSSMASIPYVGPVLGAAAAAAALASGYANVKAIYATNADGSNVSTSIAAPAALNTTPISYTKELIGDKEKDIINQPIRCFVTETDITETQNKVKVTENNASF